MVSKRKRKGLQRLVAQPKVNNHNYLRHGEKKKGKKEKRKKENIIST
jgi:hypothetical protein